VAGLHNKNVKGNGKKIVTYAGKSKLNRNSLLSVGNFLLALGDMSSWLALLSGDACLIFIESGVLEEERYWRDIGENFRTVINQCALYLFIQSIHSAHVLIKLFFCLSVKWMDNACFVSSRGRSSSSLSSR
jgi:hypothetical protein